MISLRRGNVTAQLRFPRSWPAVVLYHSFYEVTDPSDPFLDFNLPYERFCNQLDLLARGYRIVDEAEFLTLLLQGEPERARGTCLITIDDGYRALMDERVRTAFSSRGIRPLLFLLSGFLEQEVNPWYARLTMAIRRTPRKLEFDGRPWDLTEGLQRHLLYRHVQRYFLRKSPELAEAKLAELLRLTGVDPSLQDEDLQPMSWAEAAELREEGWDIGCHAWSHHPLAQLSPAGVTRELEHSRDTIERHLGLRTRTCSYPNGSHSEVVRAEAARLFEAAFAVDSDPGSDRFQVPRRDLGAYPFHDDTRYRRVHPVIDGILRSSEAGVSDGRLSGARRKVDWLVRHARSAESQLPLRQLVLQQGLPAVTELPALTASAPAAPKRDRPRVAILCRSSPWQRYAVSRMSREFDLVGVVIERDPLDPVILARSDAAEWQERHARAVPHESRPWYPLDHPQAAILDNLFGTCWEAYHLEPGTPVLPVEVSEGVNSPRVEERLREWQPDYIFVNGTSMVQERVYSLARHGAFNVHTGLSPYYRGSHTIWWPLFEQRPEYVGGTLHLLSPKIDAGSVFAQWQPLVEGPESPYELEVKVIRQGVEAAISLIRQLHGGREVRPVTQDLSIGALYLAAEFTPAVIDEVHRRVNEGLLAEFARHQAERRAGVRLLISPDWAEPELLLPGAPHYAAAVRRGRPVAGATS